MTDVRARIADAMERELDEHGYEDDDEKRGQVAHHFTDVLLALDGIAVVHQSAVEPLRAALAAFDDYAPTTFADYHGVAGVINTARALLAAADAAERAAK